MNDKIRKLMQELKDECMLAKCPMYVTVADEQEDGTHYESEIITPLYIGKPLKDDRISPLNALESQKFRLEFIDEPKPEDIEAEIEESLYNGD